MKHVGEGQVEQMGQAGEQNNQRKNKKDARQERICFGPGAESIEPLFNGLQNLEENLIPARRFGIFRARENLSGYLADRFRRWGLNGLGGRPHREFIGWAWGQRRAGSGWV